MQALFIGQTYIDVTFITDHMPTGDEKHVASAYAVSFGGNAVTAAFCCAKLGIVPDLIATVANDWLGRMFQDMSAKYGISIHPRKVNSSSLSFIMPKDGKRAIVRCRDDEHIHPFPILNLKGCRALHVDGHQPDAAIHYAKLCREDGILTSLDGGGLRTNTHELLEFIDVAIVAERLCEQMDKTPDAMLDYLKSRGCRVGGVTMGERGLLWYDETGAVRTMPALPIARERVLDTNGAGDVFHGAYVYSYLSNPAKSWQDHFEFARAASTYKIQRLGNEAGLPTLPDIETVKQEFQIGRKKEFGIRQSLRNNMGRVFVAGSINMDVVATAGRHPRVGETVAGEAMHYFPGGKGANQAVAAAKLGTPTTLIGRLGADTFGQQLRTFLTAQGVDLAFVKDTAGTHTGTAIITIASADNTIVVVPGANALVTPEDVTAPLLAKGDIAVSQFEIPLPTIAAFFKRARAAGATTILNPAPAIMFGPELLDLVDILILNETELGLLTNTELQATDDPARFIEAARSLPTGANKIISVTLGKRGVLALIGGEASMIAGRSVTAVDTTGAGDCFVGALAAQLAGDTSIRDALTYANAAASICVQRLGAAPSMPTAAEVAALRG